MATQAQIQLQNSNYLDMLDDPGMQKQAADEGGDYIRLKLREEGFSSKILEEEEVGNDLDIQLWTDKPVKIYQKETDVPMSVVVGYGQQPINFYIRSSRFAVTPTTIMSPKVQKHKYELRTYKFDVRQVFADNIVKDLQAAQDKALLTAVNTILVSAGTALPGSGVAQWQNISGGFSRSAVVTACRQVLQATPYNIPVETNVINNITWAEHLKWQREEAGGDYSEKLLMKGAWATSKLLDENWLVTIKRQLVANSTQYLFGPQKFLGKSVLFTPPTMYVENKVPGVYSFFCMKEVGTTLAHTGALGKVTYLAA